MRITLCEDDGRLNDGKPTLVILEVDFGGGRRERIPYQASKTIQELYVDVNKMIDDPLPEAGHTERILLPADDDNPEGPYQVKTSEAVKNIDVGLVYESKKIGREDIVRCVKKHPREEHADDYLVIGNEYRVFSVNKHGYELLDDNSPNKIAFQVLKDEVELVRKRKKKPPRGPMKYETTKKCECGVMNALQLNGDKYEGECMECGAHLEVAREPEKKGE